MSRYKIVFLCHFSNPEIRSLLSLNKYTFRKAIYKLTTNATMYDDFAVWVSDYIEEFEKLNEFEIHIVAPHYGMRHEIETFELRNIHYHFFRWNYGIVYTAIDKLFHIEEKNKYARNRKKMREIINGIGPDLVILCGAENPYYSIGVIDIQNIPVYVILQTLLNDPKRIEMGVGDAYKRMIELEVFRHARYFCASGKNSIEKIEEQNPNVVFLPVPFPTHRPKVDVPTQKEYDFVFFARGVAKNKGIEDVLKALALVKEKFDQVSLNIIGECEAKYKRQLNMLIQSLGIGENIQFAGYYQQIRDTFDNVVKAKSVVIPGITAGLNSTVRESMIMGMPTICYETDATKLINKESTCILTAPMGDVAKLAEQMIFALESPKLLSEVAARGRIYAESVFSNTAIVDKLVKNCELIISKKI